MFEKGFNFLFLIVLIIASVVIFLLEVRKKSWFTSSLIQRVILVFCF